MRGFRRWLEEWGRTRMTIRTYTSFAARFLRQGRWLTTRDVQEFLARYQGNSRATAFYSLRALARYLESMGYPVDVKWNLIPRRWRDPRLGPLSRDQVRRLAEAADSLEDKALVLVMYDLALRISEAARLTWRSLYVDSEGRCWLEVRRVKGGEPRSYPLSPEACRAVLDLKRYLELMGVYSPDAPMFGSRSPDRLRERVKRLARRAKLASFKPHQMRRSRATHLSEEGWQLEEIMELGGWRDVRTVMRYVRVQPARIAEKKLRQEWGVQG